MNSPAITATPEPDKEKSAASRQRATVAYAFVTGMLAGCRKQGVDAASLLAAVGITGEQRVPLADYAALYNHVNQQLDDEAFGLFSQPMRVGSFEFLCRGLLSAATLAEALDRAIRFLRLVLPDMQVDIGQDAHSAWLSIRENVPLAADSADSANDPARVFAFEWLLRLLHGLACWLVGRGLTLDEVTFPYSRPPHAADYALIYTEHSHFGGTTALLARFNAHFLDLPIRRDEQALTAFLAGGPGRLTTLYRRDREMVQRVRDTLRDALPASLGLDQVADRLHLSERTLHRRLADEGVSFRVIKDALRRDLALARLAKSQHSVADIAAYLGYTDPSAFYRSFVAWTGVSPSQYRKRVRSGE